MRQVKIEYENFERPENQELVAGIIETYSFLFPVWLKTLTVSVYDKHPESDTMDAWSSGTPGYGTAEIGIKTKFFDRLTHWQCAVVVHEILHIAHMRLCEFIHDRLLAQVKDRNEELHAFLDADMHERLEEFIENTAVGIAGARLSAYSPKSIESYAGDAKYSAQDQAGLRVVPKETPHD